MGVSMKKAVWVVSFLAAGALSTNARAEDAFLHHAHAGALLAYAEQEVQILYATFLAKEFDPELAKTLLKELERSLNDSKRSVDRTRLILGEDKMEPELTKLLDLVKRAESQLRDLSTDVEEQTGSKEEESDHRDELSDEEKSGPKRDWGLLKNGASWLYQDIKDARAFHGNVGKKLKGGPLKMPTKPSGKREKKEK
jgi:hypothetical protein